MKSNITVNIITRDITLLKKVSQKKEPQEKLAMIALS